MWLRQYAPAIVQECIRAIVSLLRNIFSFNVVWFRSHSDDWKISWRFKASKYKNAAPKVPKPDECQRSSCIGSYQINGQVIKASASFMTFNADVAGEQFRFFQSMFWVTDLLICL